ncbi:MAG: hypothetical protein WCR02_06400 [Sphaerochaetaceae bacterium]
MKVQVSEVRFIPNDCVVMVKSSKKRPSTQVGQSWQPEVAQFLLDMYPGALESGLDLSQLYKIASIPTEEGVVAQLEMLFGEDFFDDFEDDENL